MPLRASRTALAMAAGGATAPPSPIPFMPYSVCGVGVCRWPILIAGISAAPVKVIGHGAGERLAGLVVGDFLEQRGADALHDAAADLAFDEHRVDHRAAILGDGVIEQFDEAGLGVDRDDGAVGRVGVNPGADRRLVGGGCVEQRVDARRQSVHAQMRNLGDLGDRDRARGPATTPPAQRTSATSHCNRCAPMRQSLSRSIRLARATAPPDMTMLRDAKVPNPKAVLSESPCRTEMRAGSMPSSSAATCDSAVPRPWPCDRMPTISTTLPSVRMRAVQL